MAITTSDTLNSARVNFNWGYWDGMSDREGRTTLMNPHLPRHNAYTAGYEAAFHANPDLTSSEDAWQEALYEGWVEEGSVKDQPKRVIER